MAHLHASCALQDVKSIAWHPSRELLASCSYDNSIKLWANDEADWVCVQTLEGEGEGYGGLDVQMICGWIGWVCVQTLEGEGGSWPGQCG